MITEEDIRLLVASGEGYNAGFKVSVPSKVKELAQEICAFANAAGGVVLIGVDDKNKIRGTAIDNAKRSAIQNAIGDISPTLRCTLSMVNVDDKQIGVIEVPSGADKPYVLTGSIYVRIGPNSQKLTTAEQMRDFFQHSTKIFFDEAACEDFDPIRDIDSEVLDLFKQSANITMNTPNEQIFKNLKLLTVDNHFKNGAVLFFGKNPEAFFEKAILRCVAFKGLDKRYIIDDKFFGGPLYVQYSKAIQWLKEKTNLRYDIEGQGAGPRKEIWEIPETVFKEAIVNALAHRDYYDKGATIIVELYDDRIEISNPGGLVSAIKPADFGKRSHSRNPLIFGLFARMQLVEQVGSGILRMNDLMEKADLPVPEFTTEGMFAIMLKRPAFDSGSSGDIVGERLGDKLGDKTHTRTEIINHIIENKHITTQELVDLLGITNKGVQYHLAAMQKDGILKREGSRKTGYWIIVSKN